MRKATQAFIAKVLDYAQVTGIEFNQTGRHDHSKSLGIPNMRGFSPHLRKVNLGFKQKQDLWVIHDLLHILFYDFVSFHRGKYSWKDEVYFFENHLASEAFAVLALDYHVLSFEKSGGLAVEVSSKKWKSFQKFNPQLPDFLSEEFCASLLDLYLCGETEILEIKKGKSIAYGNWLGHEVRYSEKQRFYVKAWWNNLNLLSHPKESFLLEQSPISDGVWELLDLLLYQPGERWQAWLSQAREFSRERNYFSELPLFHSTASSLDFRFSHSHGISGEERFEILDSASGPSAEVLFLMWQMISEIPFKKIPPGLRMKIKKLAKSSQSKKIDLQPWNAVRKYCLELKSPKNKSIGNQSKGYFFLP